MSVTAYMYGKAIQAILSKKIDWVNDAIKVALCDSGYVPDQDVHDYFNDITHELANGNGYASGGALLPTPTLGYASLTNVTKLSGSSVVWSAPSTFTARYAIIYNSTPGSDATNPLIGYVDFGEDKPCVTGTFTITWNAAGIFTFTV
jgi:hypothetical protein